MTNSALDRLVESGSIAAEPPDSAEFEGLTRSGRIRLQDAGRTANALDSRFDLAYSAAHAYCLAAMRHAGYRALKRYIVFQALPHTLGLGPEVWRVLDKCHSARNRTEYEGAMDVDVRLLNDLIAATKTVASAVEKLTPL